MELNTKNRAMWKEYLDTLLVKERPQNVRVDAWAFGNSSDMADRLLAAVLEGVKTATSGLQASYEVEDEPLPSAGDFSILLDGAGEPRAVIQTLELMVQPFRGVGEDIAFEEGEGDRSLSYWREVHWHFFAQECGGIGIEPDWEMKVVSERFQLVYVRR